MVIVGDGPERYRLELLSSALGLGDRIHFTGHMENPRRAYRGFDIFALSSDTEQMPFTILEAMAAGLPIASTGVGDIDEMVSAPNRAFVSASDEIELAQALKTLLGDARARTRLGQGNRSKALNCFNHDAMVEAYDRLFSGNCPATAASQWRGVPQ